MVRSVAFAVFMLLVGGERLLETRASTRALRGEKAENWSLPLLFILHTLILASVVVEFYVWQRPLNLWITGLGLFLYVLSLGLRLWAVRTLAEYWSLHVELRPTQPLIKTGPYRLVRHPAYTAIILEFIAIPLVGNCYASLGLVLVFYFPVLAARIVTEEKALIKKFGPAYNDYQDKVGALLPFRAFSRVPAAEIKSASKRDPCPPI
jgi:methyltransferase